MSRDVIVNLGSFDRFTRLIDNGFNGGAGPVREAFLAWGTVYRSFIKRRFTQLSRSGGGGVWKPLAESTIVGRRHGKKGKFKRGRAALNRAKKSGGGQVSLLRDTNQLLTALSPKLGKPGQIQRFIKNGLKVGIGGPAQHKGSRLTIGQLAAIHHFGTRRIPARPIFVRPDRPTVNRMARILDRGIKRARQVSGA